MLMSNAPRREWHTGSRRSTVGATAPSVLSITTLTVLRADPTFFPGHAAAVALQLDGKVQHIGHFGILHRKPPCPERESSARADILVSSDRAQELRVAVSPPLNPLFAQPANTDQTNVVSPSARWN